MVGEKLSLYHSLFQFARATPNYPLRILSSENFLGKRKENMKKTAKIHQEREEKSRGVWDCGSPLYDSYELVSLSSIIERHLMKVPSLGRSKRVAAAAAAISTATNQASQPRSGRSTGNSNRPSNATSMEELVGKKKKEKAKTLKKKFYVIFSKIGLFKKEANPNEII